MAGSNQIVLHPTAVVDKVTPLRVITVVSMFEHLATEVGILETIMLLHGAGLVNPTVWVLGHSFGVPSSAGV